MLLHRHAATRRLESDRSCSALRASTSLLALFSSGTMAGPPNAELLEFHDLVVGLVHVKPGVVPTPEDKSLFLRTLEFVRGARTAEVKMEAADKVARWFACFPEAGEQAFDVVIDLLEDPSVPVRLRAISRLPLLAHGSAGHNFSWKIGDLLTQLLGDAEGEEVEAVEGALKEVLRSGDAPEVLKGMVDCVVGREKGRRVGLKFLAEKVVPAGLLPAQHAGYLGQLLRGALEAGGAGEEFELYASLLGKLEGGDGMGDLYLTEAKKRAEGLDPADAEKVSSLISLARPVVPLAKRGAAAPAGKMAALLLPLFDSERYGKLASKHQTGLPRLTADLVEAGGATSLDGAPKAWETASALFKVGTSRGADRSAESDPVIQHLASPESPDLARIEPAAFLLLRASAKAPKSALSDDQELSSRIRHVYQAAQDQAAELRARKAAVVPGPGAGEILAKLDKQLAAADNAFALVKELLKPFGTRGMVAVKFSWRPPAPPEPPKPAEKRKAEEPTVPAKKPATGDGKAGKPQAAPGQKGQPAQGAKGGQQQGAKGGQQQGAKGGQQQGQRGQQGAKPQQQAGKGPQQQAKGGQKGQPGPQNRPKQNGAANANGAAGGAQGGPKRAKQ
ncbi:apoptosis inhibitory protein 5-domain-containing protein [Hyaloraphidium curvatum]|nr:apoptosis inhibitory protein 5-domain-containing protein [Hyaloraphidium curvatum]